MRESSKAALCGIVSALSVVVMLSTYISPFLVYTAPAFAGILLLLIYNEVGIKGSIATYVSICLLSLFVISDKESAVFFTMLFGYFPILSCYLNGRIKNGIVRLLIKISVFNFSCLISLVLCTFVIGISTESIFDEGLLYVILFVALLNVLFFVYDVLIGRLQILYLLKFQRKFRKMFNYKKKRK